MCVSNTSERVHSFIFGFESAFLTKNLRVQCMAIVNLLTNDFDP